MLAPNGSVGPSNSNSGNTTTLLTVNGIIPNQQMSGQHGNRPGPIFTPFFPNTTFTTFQSPFSGPTSVVPCIASPNGGTIFQGPGGQFPFNMTGSMLLTQPQSIINGTPISYQAFSHPVSVANASNGTTVVLTANDMCISSSGQLPIFQNGAIVSMSSSNNTQTTNVCVNSNTSNNNNSAIESTAPSIKCKPEVKPVAPLATVANSNSGPESNVENLEKSQFHRELILEAIDKLRDRKARPDVERISCLMRRQHNIQPTDTHICLTRLAETGSILCVDYKGNLSYRNPAKWRKTAASAGGIANKPNISKRLIEAVRSLIPEGGDKSQSFTLLQIEQAIKNQKPPQNPEGESESNASANALPPELTGSGLKISLDKEVNYGGLAKLHDGRYVLDENGEKKHRSLMFNFNRRPFPGKLAVNGAFGKPPIAPALDTVGGKPYNVFSLTPGRPLARRPPMSTGKRGRPPSIKNKKMLTSCSQQPILPAPADNMMEKRIKLETVPVTPTQTTTYVPIDGTVMVSATPMQTLSLTPAQQVTPPVSVSGGPNAAPTAAMMMYPGIYNHPTTTLFTVTPDATSSLMGSTFQSADATGAALSVTLNTSNTVVANSTAPTESIVVFRPTTTLATTTVTTPAKETQKPVATIASINQSPIKEPNQTSNASQNEGICCRCQQKVGDDVFLVCQDCGIKAHPKCLDFSPEAAATARQNNWQCANCKPCSVCKVKKQESTVLICDACDKGYHDTCHNPTVTDRKSADQTTPWICSSCQGLGYHVSASPPVSGDSKVTSLPPTAAITPEAAPNAVAEVKLSTSAEVETRTDQMPDENHPQKSRTRTSPSKEASTNTVENQEQMEVDGNLTPNVRALPHDISEAKVVNTRPENVRHWTASQVADWLREQGNYEREADIFRENEIDGCALMLLKNYNLLIDAKIKIGPAVKILEKVRLLQASMDSRGLGIFKPGINVILGPTGCGKTTFLDVLAGRTDPSLASGCILIDGKERPSNFNRCSGYVSQDNFAMESLTVRENLNFSAALRLPARVTRKERDARVSALIKKLGLSVVANVKVGSEFVRGISGGERKRTNIGVELITDPSVIFLDEPTTGLDTYTASKLMKLLKRLSAEGKTIIATIHQPNWSIYKLFDSVTLLCNGRAIYHGPAGDSPLNYFCDLGYKISNHENPADFFIDLLHQDLPAEARSRLGLSEEINGTDPAEGVDEVKRLAICSTRILHLQQLFESSTEWSSWVGEAKLIFSSWCSTRKPSSRMSRDCSSTQFHSISGSEAELSPLMTSSHSHMNPTISTALSPSDNEDIQNTPRMDSASFSNDAFVSYASTRKSPTDLSDRRAFDCERGCSNDFEPIPCYRQFAVLAARGFLNTMRNPKAAAVPFAAVAVFTMMLGTVYYQLGLSRESGLQNRTGLFFFLCLELAYFNGNAVDIFILDRPQFRHERACGFYRTSMYFLAKLICEVMPVKLGPILVFFPILYTMTGLRKSFAAMFFFEITCICMGTAAAGITMFSVLLFEHVALGYAISGIILSFMMSFGGFLLNVVSAWWLGWCRYLSIFWYAYSSLSVNEIHGATFCPMSKKINSKYLTSPFGHGNFSRTACVSGDDFLTSKGIVFEPTWRVWINPLALAIISCAVYFLCYIRLRLTKVY